MLLSPTDHTIIVWTFYAMDRYKRDMIIGYTTAETMEHDNFELIRMILSGKYQIHTI